jgi:hypothetical protein
MNLCASWSATNSEGSDVSEYRRFGVDPAGLAVAVREWEATVTRKLTPLAAGIAAALKAANPGIDDELCAQRAEGRVWATALGMAGGSPLARSMARSELALPPLPTVIASVVTGERGTGPDVVPSVASGAGVRAAYPVSGCRECQTAGRWGDVVASVAGPTTRRSRP